MDNSEAIHNSVGSSGNKGRKCNDVSRWKLAILSFVVVLIIIATIAACIGENGTQSQLGLLSPSQDGDNGQLPTIFSGQLQGSRLRENSYASDTGIVSPEAWSSEEQIDPAQVAMTRELRFLIEFFYPIISRISEGNHHTDFIASRRNDETIVLKGSPQHHALAWLSHAIVCQDTAAEGSHSYTKETVASDQAECVSLLSHSQLLNRYALATMYFAWNGKNWKNADAWLSYLSKWEYSSLPRSTRGYDIIVNANPRKLPYDVCLWKGVTCQRQLGTDPDESQNSTSKQSSNHFSFQDEQGEQIVALDLSEMNLVGNIGIVKELRFLKHLEIFDLSGNRLFGVVPKEFGRLEELMSLNLSRNQLSGSIPVSIAKNLTKLEVVKVQDNFLVGGLEGFRFAAPCKKAHWKEFSADCFGDKPRIECPCCTKCCGTIGGSSGSGLRGTSWEQTKNETVVCQDQLPGV